MRQLHFIGIIALYSTLLVFAFAQQPLNQNSSTSYLIDQSYIEALKQSTLVLSQQANDTSFKANASLVAAQINLQTASNLSQQAENRSALYVNLTANIRDALSYLNDTRFIQYNGEEKIYSAYYAARAVSQQAQISVTNLTQENCDSVYALAVVQYQAANESNVFFQQLLSNAIKTQQDIQYQYNSNPTDYTENILIYVFFYSQYLQLIINGTNYLATLTNTSVQSALNLKQNLNVDQALKAYNDTVKATQYSLWTIQNNLWYYSYQDYGYQAYFSQLLSIAQQNQTIAMSTFAQTQQLVQKAQTDLIDAQVTAVSAALSATYAAQTAVKVSHLSTMLIQPQSAANAAEADRVKAAKARAAKARCDFAQHRVDNATKQMTRACQGQSQKKN